MPQPRPRFADQLSTVWHQNDSMLCVGLDPDVTKFPKTFGRDCGALLDFCKSIVDATGDLACAFKPQIAYFASVGAESQLAELIAYIHARWPAVPVILDAKRGDIGATAEHYAREAFLRYNADALTLSPFMGFDSLEPYFAYPERGLILLCRTSNPGGDDLQMQRLAPAEAQSADRKHSLPAERVFERIARLAAGPWNRNGQLGLVVGATYPQELARVRELAPNLPLLVPGIGAQGGDIEASVRAGAGSHGYGMIVNSSRAILYASAGGDFQEAARKIALLTRDALRDAHNRIHAKNPASQAA